MQSAISSIRPPDLQAETKDGVRRLFEFWFAWMDRILDIHRSNYVFREFTRVELEEHKKAFRLALQYSNFVSILVGDPESGERDLAARLQIRIRQLQDAYDTFHDKDLSDEQAEKILKQAFPE